MNEQPDVNAAMPSSRLFVSSRSSNSTRDGERQDKDYAGGAILKERVDEGGGSTSDARRLASMLTCVMSIRF